LASFEPDFGLLELQTAAVCDDAGEFAKDFTRTGHIKEAT
jgi:hypothetical protein